MALRRSHPLALEDVASSFEHIRDDIVVVVDVVVAAAAVVDVAVDIADIEDRTDAAEVGPMSDS